APKQGYALGPPGQTQIPVTRAPFYARNDVWLQFREGSVTLREFVIRHRPQPPRRAPANADELRRLGSADGVRGLESPPPEVAERGRPETAEAAARSRHLWVFAGLDAENATIPFLLERAVLTQPLASGVVK